jgi:hypothetical protein
MNEAVPLYDPFSADYDRFVNWEERLAVELPYGLVGAGLAPAQGDCKGSPLHWI